MPSAHEKLVTEYARRVALAIQERANFNAHWDNVSDVTRVAAASFTATYTDPGKRPDPELYDGSGVYYNQLLAAGFYGLLTNPSQRWFNLTTTNPQLRDDRDVLIWLKDVSNIMFTEMQRPQSGFQTALHEAYLDYGSYGNCVLFVTEQVDLSALQYTALPMQECFFFEGSSGYVESLMRRYTRNVAQIVERFGHANCAKEVQDAFDAGNYNERVEVLHVIEPNRYAYDNEPLVDKPYVSLYIDLTHKALMRAAGYEEKPFMGARFYKNSFEIYGRGPGSTALADLQMLQAIKKTTLRGAQKIVDPPILFPDDGTDAQLKTIPGGITYYRPGSSQDQIRPLLTGAQPQWGEKIAEDIRSRVRDMFFVNQLQLNEGPQMTATEVLQRTEEKTRLLGPVIGRAMTELLSPCLTRTFGLLLRAGALPQPPAQLMMAGPKLGIAYTSPFAKAIDQEEANGLLRVTQLIAPFVQADPTIMDNFDGDQMVKHFTEMYALDPRLIRDPQAVAKMRAQRAQQQQMASMTEQAGVGASALNQVTSGMVNLQKLQGGRVQ